LGNERISVVKDFCFPNGVGVKLLDFKHKNEKIREEAQEIALDVLYRHKNWREDTFVFTLDANSEDNGGDSYYNCMCLIF